MEDLEIKVKQTIINNKLIQVGDKIVLAVSGGPDSICMLNILNNITKKQMNEISVNRTRNR